MNGTPRLLGGRYEVGDLLGRGGMAEVHLGRDARLGRSVAIKMLRSDLARDPSFQARFRREAQSAAALNHPAVVAVYDSGEEPVPVSAGGTGDPVPYIVMEYVEGHTLRELLTEGKTVAWQEALRITGGVLAALAYSHRAGIVHRDIKPANVMLTPNGDVKVMDFGIARALADTSATMTQTQAVVGTAQYLSPEQALGETVDARSDLYSTGCLLYELVTGRPPFVADSPVAVAYQHVGEPPKPPSTHAPDLPPPIDAIILHALVKDRAGRYQSAEEFRDDVDAAIEGRRISSAALGTAAGFGAGAAAGATTQAISAVPGHDATTTMTGLPTGRPTDPTLRPDDLPDRPEKPNRNGLWVLLGLLAAALIALGVLVLPNLLGNNTPTVPTVSVPNLVGKTEAQAGTLLQAQGLRVGTKTQENSPDVKPGSVIDQSPAAGTQLDRGKTVDLTISAGPGTVDVPDLTGMTKSEATATLKDAGLALGKVTEVESTDQRAGRVVRSDPATGSAVAPKSKVAVDIASGKVAVPNVVGQSLPNATKTLTDAGLVVDATKYEVSTQPEGTVTSQSITGKTVDQGTKIDLTIAKAAPTPTSSPPTPTESGPPTESGTPSDTASPKAGGPLG